MSFINTATIGEGYEGLANAVIIRALVDYYDAQRTIKEYFGIIIFEIRLLYE